MEMARETFLFDVDILVPIPSASPPCPSAPCLPLSLLLTLLTVLAPCCPLTFSSHSDLPMHAHRHPRPAATTQHWRRWANSVSLLLLHSQLRPLRHHRGGYYYVFLG